MPHREAGRERLRAEVDLAVDAAALPGPQSGPGRRDQLLPHRGVGVARRAVVRPPPAEQIDGPAQVNGQRGHVILAARCLPTDIVGAIRDTTSSSTPSAPAASFSSSMVSSLACMA